MMNAEIENNIRNKVAWSQLPSHLKQILNNSPKEYERYIVSFSIKNQLRYRGNLVRTIVPDEKRYYERVISYSKERLMLFPYHLADMIVKGLRITPFNYYIAVVEKLMQSEKSYDTLPNFTAADCLRLLGIGRNEYIELMNKSRSNKVRLFGKKNVRGLLPKVPCDIYMEPWWRIELGLVLEEDIKFITESELHVIDTLIDYGSQAAGEFDYNTVLGLFKKGLVYLDVPVTGHDMIQVPPLQGFVMNRITGDYFETLLYKIFVSIDEQTTIGELAAVLQVDTELVKQAVSLYCRLKFARKLHPDNEKDRARRHPSWNELPIRMEQMGVEATPLTISIGPLTKDDSLQDLSTEGTANQTKSGRRIAFLFDSTLTAYLMMGNLSPGLKKHAVTMFEVGKLTDESLDNFLQELEKVSVLDADGEGEARRFFDHAVILRSTILTLRKVPGAGLDLIRMESLQTLDEATCLRLLRKKYRLLVSMAPLSREVRPVVSFDPPHLGPVVPEANSIWFKLYLYHLTGYGPPSLLLRKGTRLDQLPRMFIGFSRLLVTTWLHEPAVLPSANVLQINAASQYSPVLIQAYGVQHAADLMYVPFPLKHDLPDKFERFRAHPAARALLDGSPVDLERNCGYLTFASVGTRDFGRPQTSESKVIESNDPSNGFTSEAASTILRDELDRMEKEDGLLTDHRNLDALLSPAEETIDLLGACQLDSQAGEVWTLLDCHFGVPLFDVNANTKICDTLLTGGLTDDDSLTGLVESGRRLSTALIDFISQCQYRPGENMEIMKRGRLVPLPRRSLVFNNGKITEWNGK